MFEEILAEKITRERVVTMGIKAFLLKPQLKKEMALTSRRIYMDE